MSAAASVSVLTTTNNTEFGYDSVDEAFPQVAIPVKPFGDFAVFQIRHPKKKTRAGIILGAESRSTEHYNTQIAKVIALGPLCFQSQVKHEVIDPLTGLREEVLKLALWPEKEWFRPGDFVRVPKYGGDRLTVPWEYVEMVTDPQTGRQEKETVREDIIIAIFRVKNILALETNPLAGKAYID
jgi:hypothetical protein